MKPRIRKMIDCLDFPTVYNDELMLQVQNAVDQIIVQNNWEDEEAIIDTLPEKIRVMYLMEYFMDAAMSGGLFSIFYNETPIRINRFQKTLETLAFPPLSQCFDEAYEMVKSKFSWTSCDMNFICQTRDCPISEYFGDDFCAQMKILGKKTSELLISDDFENHLTEFWNTSSR